MPTLQLHNCFCHQTSWRACQSHWNVKTRWRFYTQNILTLLCSLLLLYCAGYNSRYLSTIIIHPYQPVYFKYIRMELYKSSSLFGWSGTVQLEPEGRACMQEHEVILGRARKWLHYKRISSPQKDISSRSPVLSFPCSVFSTIRLHWFQLVVQFSGSLVLQCIAMYTRQYRLHAENDALPHRISDQANTHRCYQPLI